MSANSKKTPAKKAPKASTEKPVGLKTIEIFRAGQHTSSSGQTLSFGEAELAASASGYDPALHEAPIVLGHPSSDAPAYGWVRGLKVREGALSAEVGDLHPSFVEAVQAGRYKKVSASFYRPDSAANPKPGTYYLRHVGFLGAQPPAVKGLTAVSFGERDDCVDFASSDPIALLRTLRTWLASQFGADAADAALPIDGEVTDAATNNDFAEMDIDSAVARVRAAVQAAIPSGVDSASHEPILAAAANASRKELDACVAAHADAEPMAAATAEEDFAEETPRERSLREANERLTRDVARRDSEMRKAQHVSFLEKLEREGVRIPATREVVVGLFTVLDGAGASSVAFGEAETRTATTILRDLLSKLPKVDFAERGGAGDGSDDAGADAPVTPAEVIAFQESETRAGRFVTTSQAADALKKKKETVR